MWLAGFKKKQASLYLATDQVVLQLPGQPARQMWSDLAWQEGLRMAAEAMKAAGQQHVAVWLSGGLARPFLIPPVQGLKRWRDVEQLAHAIAPGASQMDGPADIWIGRWGGKKPALAVATSAALHDALRQVQSSYGLRTTLLRPAWHWALTSLQDDAVHLALLLERDGCTALKCEQGQVQWVNTATPAPLPNGMSSHAARTAFAQEVPVEQARWGMLSGGNEGELRALSPLDANTPPIDVEWH